MTELTNNVNFNFIKSSQPKIIFNNKTVYINDLEHLYKLNPIRVETIISYEIEKGKYLNTLVTGITANENNHLLGELLINYFNDDESAKLLFMNSSIHHIKIITDFGEDNENLYYFEYSLDKYKKDLTNNYKPSYLNQLCHSMNELEISGEFSNPYDFYLFSKDKNWLYTTHYDFNFKKL